MLDNREVAALIWLAVLAMWLMSKNQVRRSIRKFPSFLRAPRIFPVLLGLASWVAVEVWAGWKLTIWDPAFAKTTVIWFVFTAIPLIFSAHKLGADPGFLRKALTSAFGSFAFVEYLLNLHPFPLAIELVLQPWVALVVLVPLAARRNSASERILKVFGAAAAVTGFMLLFHAIWQLYLKWQGTNPTRALAEIATPMWLTAGLAPFIYLLALYFQYARVWRVISNEQLHGYSRLKVILALLTTYHLHLYRLTDARWYGLKQLASSGTFRAARQIALGMVVDTCERKQAMDRDAKMLRKFAGSDEVDDRNRRLDRREFRETQDALRWLQTCQFGRYRNQGGRYQESLLSIVAPEFSRRGLPGVEGVHLSVSSDGQRWAAWRRTVSGWYFGIGSDGPPSNEWLFDGPTAPAGYPGLDSSWGERPFSSERSPNWL